MTFIKTTALSLILSLGLFIAQPQAAARDEDGRPQPRRVQQMRALADAMNRGEDRAAILRALAAIPVAHRDDVLADVRLQQHFAGVAFPPVGRGENARAAN